MHFCCKNLIGSSYDQFLFVISVMVLHLEKTLSVIVEHFRISSIVDDQEKMKGKRKKHWLSL